MNLNGKTVLVTGANGGVGGALVKALLDKGVAKIYAAARSTASVAELLQQHAGRVVTLKLDITDTFSVAAAAEQCPDVDLLINNAGVTLAEDLGLGVGDKLRLTTPEGGADVFTVSGIFDFGDQNVNERWVLVSLRAAQTLLDLEAGITTIEAKAGDPFRASALADALGPRTALDVDSWMTLNAQLLTALRSQSASALMIQSFVVIAVALGIASVLGVSVIQKSRQIGILKATGTSTGTVVRVFLAEGALVGVAGSMAGCFLGAGMSWAFAVLVENPYGESLFPVELGPGLFLLASGVAIATSIAASVAPAVHAARLEPAVVIRYG